MHRTLRPLTILAEAELTHPGRVKRLLAQKHTPERIGGAVALVAGTCMLCGFVLTLMAGVNGDLPRNQTWMLLMGILISFGVALEILGIVLLRLSSFDPLAEYLRTPERFTIAPARIESAESLAPGSRSARYRATVSVAHPEFPAIRLTEEFDARVWPFAADSTTQKGAPKLPAPAHVVFKQDNPAVAALIAVPAHALRRSSESSSP